MSKLIHSAKLVNVKANSTLYAGENYTDLAKSALIFTDDGYMVVKGTEYRISLATGALALDITNGVLKVTDSLGNESTVDLPIYDAENGLTITNRKVGHTNTKLGDSVVRTLAGVSISNYVVTTPTITYDDYGHVTAYTADTSAGTHLDYVKSSAASGTYYLLGHASIGTTAATVGSSSIFVDASGVNPTLWVPNLQVTGGASSIILGDSTNNQTLASYISNLVNSVATQAMIFRGVLTAGSQADPSKPFAGTVNGDTYKVGSEGYAEVLQDGQLKTVKVKPGDALVAAKQPDDTMAFYLIPAGDELETFIKYGSTSYSGTIVFEGSAITYNASEQKFTFTDTTYQPFTPASASAAGAEGLVPKPGVDTGDMYLSSFDGWRKIDYSQLTGTPTIGNAKLILKIGSSTYSTQQLVSEDYTANATIDTTYYFPLASQLLAASDVTWGAVKGKYVNMLQAGVGNTWTEASIADGIVRYYDHTYTITDITTSEKYLKIGTFNGNGGTTDLKVQYATSRTSDQSHGDAGVVRTTSMVTNVLAYQASPIVDGVVYYLNTWRPVYAYTLTKDSTLAERLDLSNTATNALQFGSEFVWAEGDTAGASTSEIHLAWAEVGEDGTITYSI